MIYVMYVNSLECTGSTLKRIQWKKECISAQTEMQQRLLRLDLVTALKMNLPSEITKTEKSHCCLKYANKWVSHMFNDAIVHSG